MGKHALTHQLLVNVFRVSNDDGNSSLSSLANLKSKKEEG